MIHIAFLILIAFVIAVFVFLAPVLDALIPFDVLANEVAVGFGVTAGAIILLATAIMRPVSDKWGTFVGFGMVAMLFWSDALSMFMFTAVWTLFAGGVVGDAVQRFNDIREEDVGRPALATTAAGLAHLSFPLAFLIPFETSFFGKSLPFLLGALLLALTGFSCWFWRRSVPLGLEALREAYKAAASMPLLSVFIITRRYFETLASPPISEAALWGALIAAFIALVAAFYRIERERKARSRSRQRLKPKQTRGGAEFPLASQL
ncbi:MAG: hypothetical protein OXT69_08680 [Candidatus Poribacteria bacterium]|nr:hypothetical protein [Candidatus Poribacteria bacterium]